MHKRMTRVLAAVAAGAAFGTPGVTGASASGAASQVPQAVRGLSWGTSQAAAIPGTQLWVKRYNGPGNGDDGAASVAVGSGGGKVYVTGYSRGATSGDDYATVAYGAASGAWLWASRYSGPGNRLDIARAMAVGPGGGKVFVTGLSEGRRSGFDYATVAYNAATGARLWVARYNGPANGYDDAASVAVSPDGGKVYVTGTIARGTSREDYATVAYNAATGAQLWVKRYNGPANRTDSAASVAAGPGGKTVYVTGSSTGARTGFDYATVAYSAATGAQLWVRRFSGPGPRGEDQAVSLAVSPGGGKVFVTGYSQGARSGFDYATIAYNAATGARLWVALYNGPANNGDFAASLAVGPGGGRVFVTGNSAGATQEGDYATVAYNAATGTRLWVARYNSPANSFDVANSVAISPTGRKVFVTGVSAGVTSAGDYATVAYNAATGTRLWVARYNGPGSHGDEARSVAVSPNGGTVFVTGGSFGATSEGDYATVAYRS